MRRLLALPVLAVALTAAGCGTGGIASGPSDLNCRQEALRPAVRRLPHACRPPGRQGKVGPNLDDAFKYDRKQGFAESSIQNVVLEQIRIAEPPMPANLVTGQDAENVAAYVASVAGK